MEQQIEHNGQVLATSAETNGSFGLIARTLPPFHHGDGVRRHAGQFAGCYVLAGIVALTRGEATVTLSAGEFALLEPGEPHRCWNPSASPAQLLLLFAPGGDAEALRRLAGDTPGDTTEAWDTS